MAKEQGIKTLKAQLKAEELCPLYLFWGEEAYLRDHYQKEIRQKLLPPGLEAFNYHRFSGKDLDLVAFRDALMTLPVFAPRKLIEVQDFDFYKANADTRDTLDALLADLPDTICLVFSFSDTAFKPDGRMKIHRHFKTTGLSVEFVKQELSDLISWVSRRLKASNKEIDRQTAEYLLFFCGALMSNLAGEMEKLAAYAREDKITRAHIDAACTPVLDAVVWKFTDALADKNLNQASQIVGELILMRENPILILAATGKKLRQLLSAQIAIGAGRGEAAYLKNLLGINHEYPAKLLLTSARKLKLDWCKSAVLLAAKADLQMKSTGRAGEEILTDFLLELAAL